MSLKIALARIRKAQNQKSSELDLSGLKLTKTPSELSKLTELTHLNLSDNQLTDIKALEKLTHLTELDLRKNLLTEIKTLEKLTLLTTLDLGDNQLTDIKALEKLTQLSMLYVDDNQLTNAQGLEQLTQLKFLWLQYNQFTEFPEFLLGFNLPIVWELIAGEYCIVGYNPFTNPPPEIIKQGNKAIQEYFDQRKKTGEELLNEAKLILLGDGRSGKTSLANRLLGKELPKEADRTQGVDIVIGEYSFKLSNGKDFKINIWDFAGEDKYKTLHHCFIPKAACTNGSGKREYDH